MVWQVSSNGFGLAALLGVQPRIGPRRIHKRENRAAEFRRQFHQAQRLPVPLGFGLPEIAGHALLGVAAFLMTHDQHGPAMETRETRNNRGIVAKRAVPVKFGKIGEQQADEIQGVRTLRMPRQLRSLPGAQMRVEFAPKLGNLLSNFLQL